MRNRTIQARVSEDTDQEILFLQDALGIKHVTDIITLSIHRLALEHKQEKAKQSPFEALEELGLIGCIKNANPSLSKNYKSVLSKSLKAKHANF